MTEKEIIKTIMEDERITQAQLAEKAGFKRQSNVSELLRSNSIRVDNFVRLMTAMGYTVSVTKDDKEYVLE